ncbi:MAG: hypothetical protein KGY75_06700 [Candidatus Cloacimonetes bacterium]|nr:hypothetical protein [Candidatus Cloacimonadota bacterium]MBS3767790.1 hypothetical protein [Candidatus Cloacimonadota bacterium]
MGKKEKEKRIKKKDKKEYAGPKKHCHSDELSEEVYNADLSVSLLQ